MFFLNFVLLHCHFYKINKILAIISATMIVTSMLEIHVPTYIMVPENSSKIFSENYLKQYTLYKNEIINLKQ